jgi:ketosteroid isomerase-like protein
MSEDLNVETVHRFFELMHVKDIDAWAELWADDAHIDVFYPPEGFPSTIDGKAEIVAGFHRLFANFETFDYTIRALYRTDDPEVVVVESSITARVASTGDLYQADPIYVIRFRDGKIVEHHDYFDPRRFAVVVAAMAEAGETPH